MFKSLKNYMLFVCIYFTFSINLALLDLCLV